MDCEFNPNLVPVQRIVTRVATVTDYVMTQYYDVTRMVYKTLAPDDRRIVIGPDQAEQEARLQHSTIPILRTTQNYRFTSQVYSTFPFMVHLSPDFVLPISLH